MIREGVFIPRRDTSSRFNTFIGGKLFPGLYHHVQFEVAEHDDYVRVALDSDDGQVHVMVEGRLSSQLPAISVFPSLPEASAFFEAGSVGYSVRSQPGEYDGLELCSLNWKVEPLSVKRIESSFFEDQELFPAGSLRFDGALLMRDIKHEWYRQEPLGNSVFQGWGLAAS